jgi:hypothetical protein
VVTSAPTTMTAGRADRTVARDPSPQRLVVPALRTASVRVPDGPDARDRSPQTSTATRPYEAGDGAHVAPSVREPERMEARPAAPEGTMRDGRRPEEDETKRAETTTPRLVPGRHEQALARTMTMPRADAQEAPPALRVNIGRIDVHAPRPAPTPRPAATRTRPVLSLRDYLQQARTRS